MRKPKQIKAWGIARTKDDILLDDGTDAKDGTMLVVFPVFRKKKHALHYRKDTYGNKYARGIAKIIPVLITPIINNKTKKK